MKRIIPKLSLLSAITILLQLAAPMTVLADAGGEDGLTQTADGYQVTLVFEEPVASGENPLHIQVVDDHGQPVSKALVEVAVIEVEDEHSDDEEDANQPDDAAPNKDSHGSESKSEPTAAPAAQNAMGGMTGVEAAETDEHEEMEMTKFTAGHEAGEYEGEIEIPTAGDWKIRVHVTVDEHLLEFEFPIHVAGSESGKNILFGFFALNVVILGAAFAIKLQSIS